MEDIRPDWLKSLAEKTWNLELIISGAATYLASYLPEITDNAFYYFLDNFVRSTDHRNFSMAFLAYSFMKMIAYLLPVTFVVHFAMRAFWASLVGVHTVFPLGIQYDKIPGQKAFAKNVYEKHYGTLANYILRLDRLCNQVFGFAFTIVFFGIGLSVIYFLTFVFTAVVKPLFPRYYDIVTTILLVVVAGSTLLTQLTLNKIKEEDYPRLYPFLAKFILFVPQLLFPFIYAPLNYLNMVFSSNVNKFRYYAVLFFVGILIFVGVIGILINVRMSVDKRDLDLIPQQFWGKNENRYNARSHSYEDQLPEKTRPNSVMLPSEMATGSLLKVFVTYPKSLDEVLGKYCSLPTLSDSMPKMRRRIVLDSLRSDCFSKMLYVSVNDSVYQSHEWVFQRHTATGVLGVMTYLPTSHFKTGKNVLTIQLPTLSRKDSMQTYGEVPFWFGRD